MGVAVLIAFPTTNSGKIVTAVEHLTVFGITVVPASTATELNEIQSLSAIDVARHKARQAHHELARPLMCQDSGFEIIELGGYPGPMVEYLLRAVGPAGITHLADRTGRTPGPPASSSATSMRRRPLCP